MGYTCYSSSTTTISCQAPVSSTWICAVVGNVHTCKSRTVAESNKALQRQLSEITSCHCKDPHIRNSRISTQFWPLTCVPPSPVLGDANRCKRAREMDQFGRWTMCRSDDLSCMAGNRDLVYLCCVLALRASTVQLGICIYICISILFFLFSGAA